MLPDSANSYIYGLGSVTDLTADEADVVDGYTYAVFGAGRSQSGPRHRNSRIAP